VTIEELKIIIKEGESYKIEISNPGGLPKPLTAEEFGTRSVARNPIVASLLHRAGLKELATEIGLSPDGVKYHLNSLRKKGIIRHIGPTKKGEWQIIENYH
jgi:predicted HTH transcriptional regulator